MSPPLVNLGLCKMVTGRLNRLRNKPRSDGYHPSSLHRFCPVYEYYLSQARKGLSSDAPAEHVQFLAASLDAGARRFPGRLTLEFEVGDAIHAMVQYHLGMAGVLWGRWRCPACHSKTGAGFMPRITIEGIEGQPVHDPAPCAGCSGLNRRHRQAWEYLEPKVRADDWGVSGRCDGDLRVVRGEHTYRCALEIKSINEHGWTEGKRDWWEGIARESGWLPPEGWRSHPDYGTNPLPKPEHVIQASVYAWLMDIDAIYFIYVNKNQVSRWKEMMVPPDRVAITEAQKRMGTCTHAVCNDRPPLELRTCPDVRDQAARTCPAVERCFGCAPPSNFWEEGDGL